MRKLVIIVVLLIFPVLVFADSNENVPQVSNNITESPDTGVEDYFIVLGSVSILLGVSVYIVNKKNIFMRF